MCSLLLPATTAASTTFSDTVRSFSQVACIPETVTLVLEQMATSQSNAYI